MTKDERISLRLSGLPVREESRLLAEAVTAAATPEIRQMADRLAEGVDNMGPTSALEILAKVGWLLGRKNGKSGGGK